jgi:hypothetical protein
MNTISVRVSYRPIRVAWCIDEGSLEQFRIAIRLSSTLWGGKFNPIVPIGSGDLREAKQLQQTFRVDALFSLSETPKVVDFVQRASHLPWPDIHKSLFIQDGGGPLPVLLDVYHPVRELAEDREKEKLPALDGAYALPNLLTRLKCGADPLSDLLLATLGDYPDGDYCPINYGRFVDKLLGTDYLPLQAELPIDYWSRLTPLALTEHGLEVYKRRGGWDTPGVFVGDPGSFSDLVAFWNLRAANIQVVFLPEQSDHRILPATRSWLEKVRVHLETEGHFIKEPALWYTGDRDRLVSHPIFDGGQSPHHISEGTWNGLNVRPPRVHFELHSVLGTVDEGEQSISVSFSLPSKRFPEAAETQYQHVIATTHPLIDPQPSVGTFRLPYLPQLNQFYGLRAGPFDPLGARIEPDGLGTIVRLDQSYLSLRGVPVPQLLAEIFRLGGMTGKQSVAGRIATRIIHHMGGIDECRVFKIKGVRDLLHEFVASKSFTHAQALARIGRAFEAYKSLFIEPREEADLTPQGVFLHLVRKKILRTGVELKCPNCGLNDWHSLGDLAEEVECQFCGKGIQSGPQLRDGLWHYRVSGLFARTRDQEGAIPVVLSLLQSLRCLQMRGMTWLTGMDLCWTDSGTQMAAETDLAVITRNYEDAPELLVGECKTNKEIEQEQIDRLLSVAKRCSDLGVKTFLMFAKAGSAFSDRELELIDTKQTIDLNFILLGPDELEPYSPYENTKSEQVRSGIPHTLDDWAARSQHRYLKTSSTEILDRHLKSINKGTE